MKKKVIIVGILFIFILILRIVFHDAQNELPVTLNLLLGGLACYIILLFLFIRGYLKTSDKSIKFALIAFFAVLVLFIAVKMQTVDYHDPAHEGFWVTPSGQIWITDLLGVTMAILAFYIVFTWVFGIWERMKTLKNDKAKAELALLKNQINPHFFFNTLNNLYSLIKKDSEKAQQYVLQLSDMMRSTIYSGEKDKVTLEEEISYLTNYIELQTARFHKPVSVEFKKSIADEKSLVSPMLFIILLENAFKHGIEKVLSDAYINVELIQKNGSISFNITNNTDLESSSDKGIGLKNLKDRLNLLYPDSYELKTDLKGDIYSCTLTLNS